MIVKEGKISVSIVNPGSACVLVTLAFAIPVFYSFGQPLTLGVSTVPKVEKEQQEDASVTHDDVQENWVLVIAVLHEEDLAYVDRDKNKLDLRGGRMKKKLAAKRSAQVDEFFRHTGHT